MDFNYSYSKKPFANILVSRMEPALALAQTYNNPGVRIYAT